MFRKIFHQLHLYFGIAAGLVIFVVALTGSVLVFREELDDIINKKLHFVIAITNQKISYDQAAELVATVESKRKIKSVFIPEEADRNYIFRLGNKKEENLLVYVDPYAGKVVGKQHQEKKFTETVLRLHRFLVMKDTGKTITGISCIIFIFMLISGLVLWWPKNKQAIKQRFRIKSNGSFKRKNWDVHAVGGFYSFILLLIIATTGLVFAFKPVNEMIFKLADGKKPPKNEVKNISTDSTVETKGYFNNIVAKTNLAYSYKGDIYINFPTDKELAIAVNKSNNEKAVDNISSAIFFDRHTGEQLQLKPYEKNTLGQKIRRLILPIHTGSVYGWPTKLIAMAVSLFAASLPVTGTLILINRKRRKNKSKNKPAARAVVLD